MGFQAKPGLSNSRQPDVSQLDSDKGNAGDYSHRITTDSYGCGPLHKTATTCSAPKSAYSTTNNKSQRVMIDFKSKFQSENGYSLPDPSSDRGSVDAYAERTVDEKSLIKKLDELASTSAFLNTSYASNNGFGRRARSDMTCMLLPKPTELLKFSQRESRTTGAKSHARMLQYSQEEVDYIRYVKSDLDQPWTVILESLSTRFPSFWHCLPSDRKRTSVGDIYKRDNQELPELDHTSNGRLLCFLENAHVLRRKDVEETPYNKVRYSLVVLFPERAVDYNWVHEKHRKYAGELVIAREAARAKCRLQAQQRGIWKERVVDGTCFCCLDKTASPSFQFHAGLG